MTRRDGLMNADRPASGAWKVGEAFQIPSYRIQSASDFSSSSVSAQELLDPKLKAYCSEYSDRGRSPKR